jgi:hypothetical protein
VFLCNLIGKQHGHAFGSDHDASAGARFDFTTCVVSFIRVGPGPGSTKQGRDGLLGLRGSGRTAVEAKNVDATRSEINYFALRGSHYAERGALADWGDPIRSLTRLGIKLAPQPPHEVVCHVDVGRLRTLAQVTGFDGGTIILLSGFEFGHGGCGDSVSCIQRNCLSRILYVFSVKKLMHEVMHGEPNRVELS